ncbi:MAG: hypothetical protein R3234_12780 [Thermoanaerobaculia bacterium]|nr:hypothetical protein [Thermoanaerobaculia bacterium]
MLQKRTGALLALALVGAWSIGCEQKSHEERVSQLRSKYTAELNGFVVREIPEMVDVEVVDAEDGEGEAEEAVEEAAEEALDREAGVEDVTGEDQEAGTDVVPEETLEEEVQKNVILDIMVRHTSSEMLPGITVDVSQADAEGNEKASYKIWVDTSDLPMGTPQQVNEILEDVDYEEGDGFFVEVRHPVPPEKRDEYREFSEVESPE